MELRALWGKEALKQWLWCPKGSAFPFGEFPVPVSPFPRGVHAEMPQGTVPGTWWRCCGRGLCYFYCVVVATGLVPDPLTGHGHAGGVRKHPEKPYGPTLLAIRTANEEGIGCFSLRVTIKMRLDCDGSS